MSPFSGMHRQPGPRKGREPASTGRRRAAAWLAGTAAVAPLFLRWAAGGHALATELQETLALPKPRPAGSLSLEGAVHARRSVREFAAGPVALAEAAQLLWAAQGVTDGSRWRRRAAPSAGALYPLELALLAGRVRDLAPGVYRYLPRDHALRPGLAGDLRDALAIAALGQSWIAKAGCVLVLAAVYGRCTGKYGKRGEQYVHMEVGHAAQNVYLQARALGLGTTMVGAFRDRQVQRLLGFEADEVPLGLLPVGRLR